MAYFLFIDNVKKYIEMPDKDKCTLELLFFIDNVNKYIEMPDKDKCTLELLFVY